jgi:energy-coupling factor transporter transmembrane protein EcfT
MLQLGAVQDGSIIRVLLIIVRLMYILSSNRRRSLKTSRCAIVASIERVKIPLCSWDPRDGLCDGPATPRLRNRTP